MLSDEELLRYSRQIMLPEFDVAGQEALKQASAVVVGLGGLGSPAAMYLAAAGVGRLIIIDPDTVDLSNLQRQIIHDTPKIGQTKVASAKETLQRLNPGCQVDVYPEALSEATPQHSLKSADVFLDCSDNFAVRFLLNRLSVRYCVPLVSGAAIRLDGQLSVFDPGVSASPCYRCLYDESGEDDVRCATNGVLSPVVGMLGAMQALEAIKVLTGLGVTLVGRLLIVDALTMRFRDIKVKKNPDCPVCGGQSASDNKTN